MSGVMHVYHEKRVDVKALVPRVPPPEGIAEGVCIFFLAHRSMSLKPPDIFRRCYSEGGAAP